MLRYMTLCGGLSACALALLCGCGRNERQPLKPAGAPSDPAPDYVVAMIDGTPLTWAEMDRRAMGFLKDDVETNHLVIPESRMEEAKEHFRRRSIQAFTYKTLMLAAATKAGIRIDARDRDRGVKALEESLKKRNWTADDFFNKGPMPPDVMRREFEDGLIIDKYIHSQVASKIKLDEGAVEALTRKLQESNQKKREQLEDIRRQLLEGADFAELAGKFSECKASRHKGGELGEFGRGKMVKAVDEAAFSQKVGEIGAVITSPYGYHIIRVAARSPAKEATDSTPAIPETVRASHILLTQIPIVKKKVVETLQKEQYKRESNALYKALFEKAEVQCFLYEDMQF